MDTINTEMQDFTLRFAKMEDTALILRYIKELATFENEIHQVTATEEILKASLFDQKCAEVIIAEYHGKPVGFALFHTSFSTFIGKAGLHLEDLYIEPELRGKGFGKILLSALAGITVERGHERLEWWVHDWNESAIQFYEGIGAYPLDQLKIYRLTGKELSRLAQDENR